MRRIVSAAAACLLFTTTLMAADQPQPATVAQAAKVFDGSLVPLLPEAKPNPARTTAALNYRAPAKVTDAFEFHQKQLLAAKWKEQPQSYVTDQTASATFSREGFTLSLMVSPTGEKGEVSVSIINLGNVNLAKLPTPAGTKALFVGPANAMYLAETPVAETRAAVAKLLSQQGWTQYGDAEPMAFFKKNAIKLTAMISEAPAQGNKTSLMFSTEQMSADLPAPSEFTRLQYSEPTTTLAVDSPQSLEDLVAFYRDALAPAGWKQTTDKPIQETFTQFLIYRNPAGDMLTMESRKIEEGTRFTLRYQTAAQLAELEQRLEEKSGKK